jgi:hypothetical protein
MSAPSQTDALIAVFTQVRKSLPRQSMALEVLEDYQQDVHGHITDVPRLRGFLQGLAAGGALPYEDYYEVDAILIKAFSL